MNSAKKSTGFVNLVLFLSNENMKPSSLFIWRYQPFHEGHQKLIETVLNEGKDVAIAVRETRLTENNPFTAIERIQMIRKALEKWGSRVEVFSIPDIDEVCYGRLVGWKVREIRLDEETEKISWTEIRKSLQSKNYL